MIIEIFLVNKAQQHNDETKRLNERFLLFNFYRIFFFFFFSITYNALFNFVQCPFDEILFYFYFYD